MTPTTRDGQPVTKEQFAALYIFHGIFGFHYFSISEEANNLDRDLLENPEFMRDIFDTVDALVYPCGEALMWRLMGKPYEKIAKTLKISKTLVKQYENKAWRLMRHPKRSGPLRRYTEGFRKWEESFEEANDIF